MRTLRHADGCVHFSQLKKFSQSAAHYKHACETPFEPTREMKIGTAAHFLVLGPRPGKLLIKFNGDRRAGKEWNELVAKHSGPNVDILTAPEWAQAELVAAAIKADPVAAQYLKGRFEVPLRWELDGTPCATEGVDIVGDGWLGDLKTTQSADPVRWVRLASNLLYHAQMAFLEDGAKANAIDTRNGLFLIGAETKPPFLVTVLELAEETIAHGRRSCGLWLEQLRGCEENDFWPGYAQSPVPFVLPPWIVGDEEDADEDDGELEGASA